MVVTRLSGVIAAALLAGSLSGGAHAVTFDLNADWSDISNPNGVWSLNESANPLPSRANYVVGQPAWADASFPNIGHVPVWMKLNAAGIGNPLFSGPAYAGGSADFAAGDVIVHGRCCSDLPGTGEANVTWTSNVSGAAAISGSTWWGGFNGRSARWSLFLNDILLTDGVVGDGDVFSRANPFDFLDGSGGAGVLSFATSPGDVVRFQVQRGPGSPFDHFVGVNLAIEVDEALAAPEPLTLTITASAILCIFGAGYARRRRTHRWG